MSVESISNITNIKQLPDEVLVSIFSYCSFECTRQFFELLSGGEQEVNKNISLFNARNITYFNLVLKDSSQHPKRLKLFLLTIQTIAASAFRIPNFKKITILDLSNYHELKIDEFQEIMGYCPYLTTLELSSDMIDKLSQYIPEKIERLIVRADKKIILKGLTQIKSLVVKSPRLKVIDCHSLCNLSDITWEYTPNKDAKHSENFQSSLKNIRFSSSLKSLKLLCKDRKGTDYLDRRFSIEGFKSFFDSKREIPENMILSYESSKVFFEGKYNKKFGVSTNDLLIHSSGGNILFQRGAKNGDSNEFGVLYLSDGTTVTGKWDDLYISLKNAFYSDKSILKNASKDLSIRLVGENIFIGKMQRVLSNNQFSIIYQGPFIVYKADGSICHCEYVDNKRVGNYKITYPNNVIYEGRIENNEFTNSIFILNGEPYEVEVKKSDLYKTYKYVYPNGESYQGGFKKGQPSGYGIKICPGVEIYEGEIKDGKRNGQGTLTYSDGTVYRGEFENDEFNGHGTLTYLDGESYDGEFKNGEYHGEGKLTFSDGGVYEGEFENDELNGQGTLTHLNGEVYDGKFINGEYHGEGTLTFPDGKRYQGKFKDDKYHGHGKLTFSGGVYEGEFENDEFNGQGTLTNQAGIVFHGEFKDGKRNGQFKVKFSDGSVCEGEFEDDKPVGQGITTLRDGCTCQGDFVDLISHRNKDTGFCTIM